MEVLLGQKMFLPKKTLLLFTHLLQLHQFNFVFSKPNRRLSPSTYKSSSSIPDLTAMVDNCYN